LSKSKEMGLPRPLRSALEVEDKTFQSVTADLFDASDRGKFGLLLTGSVTRASMDDYYARILMKKHGVTKEELGKCVEAMMVIVHLLIAEELDENTAIIQEKSPKDIEHFRAKTQFISKMLEKYPHIKDNYFVYSLCKTKFFAELNWEVGLKIAHSPGTIPRGSLPSTTPFARVIFETFSGKERPSETESLEFEITEKDLDLVIESLKDLKNAIEELKTKKVSP